MYWESYRPVTGGVNASLQLVVTGVPWDLLT
jgi:hypothetical protein